MDILLQLMQNHEDILIIGNLGQHFQLLQLHIQRIVIVDEEYLQFLWQQEWSLLQHQIDRLQYQITYLTLS